MYTHTRCGLACLPTVRNGLISHGYQAVFEETISAPTPTDARKRPQVQSKTEEDQFTFLNVVMVWTASH